MTALHISVEGVPVGQGSKTAIPGKDGRRPHVINAGTSASRKAHKVWRQAVHDACAFWLIQHPMEPLDEPVSVRLSFWMPVTADPYRTLHSTTPDPDKLARAVLDSLESSGVLKNDSRVWKLDVEKVYARGVPPGCSIEVVPMGWRENENRERLKKRAAKARAARRAT
jgi:Holliday junction resolvase RusA-like endonuclease